MSHGTSLLTKEQIARADTIFEKNCKDFLTAKTVVIVDIETGQFFVGTMEDEGYSAYQEYHKKLGCGRPNVIYTLHGMRLHDRPRSVVHD